MGIFGPPAISLLHDASTMQTGTSTTMPPGTHAGNSVTIYIYIYSVCVCVSISSCVFLRAYVCTTSYVLLLVQEMIQT